VVGGEEQVPGARSGFGIQEPQEQLSGVRVAGDREEFMRHLDHGLEVFREAHRMSVTTATKFAEIIDDPSDLGVRYKLNVYMIDGTDIVEQTMQNIDNIHHGKPYLNPVPLEKVFNRWPRLQRARM
jgi:hypothetical protein